MLYEELKAVVRRLADLEQGMGHGGHRTEHAPAECHLCARWMLAVADVALLAETALWPLPDVQRALKEYAHV